MTTKVRIRVKVSVCASNIETSGLLFYNTATFFLMKLLRI